MAVAARLRGQGQRERIGRSWLVLAIIALALAAWLTLGAWSAESVARRYFLATYFDGLGGRAGNVTVESVSPVVPPFFAVTVSGDVYHTDWYTSTTSQMVLWVEPITGNVVRLPG